MKKIFKFILEQFLGNKAWAGVAVLITIFSLFLINKKPSTINQRISLIELDREISKKYTIESSNYIRNSNNIVT